MKQTVGNACGTIAVFHSLANNMIKLNLKDGFFKDFIERTKNSDPEDKAKLFEAEKEIEESHSAFAKEGQSSTEVSGVDHHFVSFVNVGGTLYEFDGRLESPTNHGKVTEDDFLTRTAAVIKKDYIEKIPDEVKFSVMTLGPVSAD